eukprot:TRINITY_DN32236_c0_g1_i2.p1 TRINITY_DN32236_c0_g1~~TRINITY_DN32236_c0_g1_i2.p1  ORF type:complete len:243 (-),score=59.90 TRINITY_DN32236_c0_g1_i2:36-764(-)
MMSCCVCENANDPCSSADQSAGVGAGKQPYPALPKPPKSSSDPVVAVDLIDEEEEVRAADVASVERLPEEKSKLKPGMYEVQVQWTERSGPGAVFDMTDPQIPTVLSIEPGSALERWNATCASASQVLQGHGLMVVDGKAGCAGEMIERLKKPGSCSMTFKRPVMRSVKFQKAGKPLGISLARTSNGLVVESVTSNGTAELAGVKVSDRIVAVNDKKGAPSELHDMIRKCDWIELGLASYLD